MRSSNLSACGISLLNLMLCGCQALAIPWLMWANEPTKLEEAEYPYLSDKTTAIVVWADMDTRFEYPYIQLEIAEHIRAQLEANVKGAKIIPGRTVFETQQRDADWERAHPAELGRRFGADRVMMVEVARFSIREPDTPHLYRGRIAAAIKIYDGSDTGAAPTYKASVDSAYPPDSVGKYGTEEKAVRLATYQAFAADVAAKFHDRRVKVR